MKKLIIASLFCVIQFANADLRLDLDTMGYYCANAPKEVNLDEYSGLASGIMFALGNRITNLSTNSHIFASLRMVGTPAALQLIKDLEQSYKEMLIDSNRLYTR